MDSPRTAAANSVYGEEPWNHPTRKVVMNGST
jgi:hypothetical protein